MITTVNLSVYDLLDFGLIHTYLKQKWDNLSHLLSFDPSSLSNAAEQLCTSVKLRHC